MTLIPWIEVTSADRSIDAFQQVFAETQEYDLYNNGEIDWARLLANHATTHVRKEQKLSEWRESDERGELNKGIPAPAPSIERRGVTVGVPWQERSISTEPVCQLPLHISNH